MNRYFLNPPNDDSEEIASSEDTTLAQVKEVDRRRHNVLDYMLLRMSPEEIAEEMDIEVQTVRNDIEEIVSRGFEDRSEDLEQIREEVVAKLRYSWTEGRKAFNKSQGEVETRTVKYGEGGQGVTDGNGEVVREAGDIEEEKIKIERKAGDPKFLQVMNDSAEKMAKVTGAQKHKEVEINNNLQQNSTTILSKDRSKMPAEYDQFLEKPKGALTPDEREERGMDKMEDQNI